MSKNNRWVIAAASFLLQMALGAVYAWSVFRAPLVKQFHWSIEEVTFTFTISIFVLGVSAFFGGLWLNKRGPRVVALTGGFLYGLGVFLASFSANKLWWLYRSYGVIGGIGVGFSYIVPVAVLAKWFPDRRGLITGVAVGGFGASTLVTAPVATRLLQSVGVLEDVRLSRYQLSRDYHDHWLLHAEPAGRVETGRLGPQCDPVSAARRCRLHAWWGTEDVAMVGSMGVAVSQYLCGHFEYRQCVWPSRLGVGLRRNHAAMDICDHVSASGRTVLVSARHLFGGDTRGSLFHHPDVLWRRVRNHAGVCSRLLRLKERRTDLRSHAYGMGVRECIRSSPHRAHAAKQRIVHRWSSPCRRHSGCVRGSARPRFAPQIYRYISCRPPCIWRCPSSRPGPK
jgi:hypothetical protein